MPSETPLQPPASDPARAADLPHLNLAPFYRLCLLVSRDLHAHLYQKVIMHPDIPREATWRRLRNAYWQASAALSGRGEALSGDDRKALDGVHEFPLLVERLAQAADAMQRELETTDWGQALFPPPSLGELGGKELRRLLALL